MAKSKRTSLDNMFGNKGKVQPQKKDAVPVSLPENNSPEPIEAAKEDIDVTIPEPEKPSANTENSVNEASSTESNHKDTEKKTTKRSTSDPKKSDIDKLFKKKKEKREQRTIYFKKEVYKFCDGIAKEYGLGLSDVVNRLIESFLEE